MVKTIVIAATLSFCGAVLVSHAGRLMEPEQGVLVATAATAEVADKP